MGKGHLPQSPNWQQHRAHGGRDCGGQPLAALPGLPPPSGAWGDLWPWSHSATEGQTSASVNAPEPVKKGLAEPHPGLSRTGSPACGRVRRRWPSVRSRSRPSPSPVQGAGGHANLHQGRKPRPPLSASLQTGGRQVGAPPHLSGTSPIWVLSSLGPHFLPMSCPHSPPLSSTTDCPHVHAWVQPLPSLQAKCSSPQDGLVWVSALSLGPSDKKSLQPQCQLQRGQKGELLRGLLSPSGRQPVSRDRRASPLA